MFGVYLTLLMLLCFTSKGQEKVDNLKKFKNGVVVVEVNADFNASNSVSFLSQLKDCKAYRIDLSNANGLNVKTVPTLIVFDSGKEQRRFDANIMMKCDAKFEEVQEIINNIILNKFQ
jgi:hypothetical protein